MKTYRRRPETVEAVQFDGTGEMAGRLCLLPEGAPGWWVLTDDMTGDPLFLRKGSWIVVPPGDAPSLVLSDSEFHRLYEPTKETP